MSEHEESTVAAEEESEPNGGFDRDEPTAKVSALKKKGMLKRDADLHRERSGEEDE